jgi:membrane protease YdiL (CAAX protease family)
MGNSTVATRWHQLLVLGFAIVFPTLMAWLYFVALADRSPTSSDLHRPNHLVFAVYALAKIVQFSFPLVWIWYVDRASFRGLAPSLRGLGLGISFGLAAAAAILLTYFGLLRTGELLKSTPALVQEKVIQFGAATPERFLLLAIFLSAIHSLLEEYYWRWFVFGELQKLVPVTLAILLSSLAFMGHHVVVLGIYFPNHFLTAAIPFSMCVALGGGAWCWIYYRTKSLYAPWLSHALVDAAIMVVGYDMVFVLK